MYRLAAFDLDNTLLDKYKRVAQDTKEAIQAAVAGGVHVILCSGRGRSGMLAAAQELGVFDREEYFISDNGGAVFKGADPVPVYENRILPEDIAWILEQGRKHLDVLNIQAYTVLDTYVERYNESTEQYERAIGLKVSLVDRLESIGDMVKLVWIGVPDALDTLRKELEGELPRTLSMFKSTNQLLEFVSRDTSKGNGVARVAGWYGIPMEQVLCMGDNENDESMIRAAGLGAAPANARESTRAAADYVAAADHHHGAVAEVLKKFVL